MMKPFALVSNRKSKNTIMENLKGVTTALTLPFSVSSTKGNAPIITLPLEPQKYDYNVDINEILNREQIFKEITDILNVFEKNCKNVNFKKGIYIYGSPGCGKTQTISSLCRILFTQ